MRKLLIDEIPDSINIEDVENTHIIIVKENNQEIGVIVNDGKNWNAIISNYDRAAYTRLKDCIDWFPMGKAFYILN